VSVFRVLSPLEFKHFLKGSLELKKPGLLFTFDDGYLNHFEIAAPLLEEFGLHGIFFISPGLLEDAPKEDGCGSASIQTRASNRKGPELSRRGEFMTAEEVLSLHQRGHEIGFHTYHHSWLKGISDDRLEYELCSGASTIETLLCAPIESFAWTYRFDNMHRFAFNLISNRYQYCYTPLSGPVFSRQDPHFIFRTSGEISPSFTSFRSRLLGAEDLLWAGRISKVERVCGVRSRLCERC
jgi:hypothetical protein